MVSRRTWDNAGPGWSLSPVVPPGLSDTPRKSPRCSHGLRALRCRLPYTSPHPLGSCGPGSDLRLWGHRDLGRGLHVHPGRVAQTFNVLGECVCRGLGLKSEAQGLSGLGRIHHFPQEDGEVGVVILEDDQEGTVELGDGLRGPHVLWIRTLGDQGLTLLQGHHLLRVNHLFLCGQHCPVHGLQGREQS